jgi:hypothetical protein
MIETWRNRPTEGEHPYVYLDGHRGARQKAVQVIEKMRGYA